MPTYPYACTACDHRFEVVQSFTDAPLTECPVCEGRLRKVFTSVGIVFKGPGFYRTDSRSSSGNGSPASSGSSRSESSASGSPAGKDTAGGKGTAGGGSDRSGPSAGTAASDKSSSSPVTPAGKVA